MDGRGSGSSHSNPDIGQYVAVSAGGGKALYPAILIFCVIGSFSINNSVFDIYVAALFGLLGYVFNKLKCEPAPLLLGFVVGPLLEENLRRAMMLSRGDASVFFTEPLSAILLAMAAGLIVLLALPVIRKERDQVFIEEDT